MVAGSFGEIQKLAGEAFSHFVQSGRPNCRADEPWDDADFASMERVVEELGQIKDFAIISKSPATFLIQKLFLALNGRRFSIL